jgi:hypothetical protein
MEIDPWNTAKNKNLTEQANMEIIQPTDEEDEERIEFDEPMVQYGIEPVPQEQIQVEEITEQKDSGIE